MRRSVAWGVAWAPVLVAGCSSSPATVTDGGADDATADAGGADATRESGLAADASDARDDGPGPDGTTDAATTDAASDAISDTGTDGLADAGADSAADSSGSPGDSAADAPEGGTVACYAMRIDQQNARISAPSTGWNLGAGDWTLEAWVKAHGAFTGGVVFVLNEAYLTNEVRLLYDDATGKIACTTYSGSCPCGKGTGNMSLAGGDLRDGAWHHAACVRQGGIGKLYVDGVESDTDVVSTDLVPASNVAFGQPSGYPSYDAAPVLVGPFRFSSVARYATTFVPARAWPVDTHTVTQYLSSSPFASGLVDEAGGDNTSTSAAGVSPSSDTPCSPANDAGSASDGGDAADAGTSDAGNAGDASGASDAGDAG